MNNVLSSLQVEVEANIRGLGLLRKSSMQPNIQNMNMPNVNNLNDMKRANTNLNEMRKITIGGNLVFLIFFI